MRLRLIPSRASAYALAALALACAVALVMGTPLETVKHDAGLVGSALLAIALIDLVWSAIAWRRAPLRWQRRLPAAFAIGVQRTLTGTLVNEGTTTWRVALFDRVDASIDVVGMPHTLHAVAQARTMIHYEVTPRLRGPVRFESADLRVRTRLGSAELLLNVGELETRRVYPNFAAVARYTWLANRNRLADIGIRAAPQRGAGTDFKQLAEYQAGDSIRHIDGKATQRHQRAIVREYQHERDQRVLFLLDCGRRMRADAGAVAHSGSHFDEALNALVLLAHVALKEGDAVGAMTFGTEPGGQRHFAPRKGSHSLNALMAMLFDIEPRATHSDYLLAAADLMRVQRKRALIVVLTNFRDEDSAELERALRLLRSHHLVLLASLRQRGPRDAVARLATRDVPLIDVEPMQLPAQLVNRYRAVKRAGLL